MEKYQWKLKAHWVRELIHVTAKAGALLATKIRFKASSVSCASLARVRIEHRASELAAPASASAKAERSAKERQVALGL